MVEPTYSWIPTLLVVSSVCFLITWGWYSLDKSSIVALVLMVISGAIVAVYAAFFIVFMIAMYYMFILTFGLIIGLFVFMVK